ncbi:hypothetical protein LJC27_06140 [Christensenellaceae bacterium OttesenSCG-928-M15]|nr:hypothetical protein [Christensenellaceae bacterium OttesenSCG-928-M15]
MSSLCVVSYCFSFHGRLCASIVTPTERYAFSKMEEDLFALKERFPRSMSLEVYGYSRQGRPLYAAIVGTQNCKRAVLIQAGIHGREHMTTTLVMMQVERLLRAGIPRDICFYMLPMTNPDGAAISQTQSGTPALDAMYKSDVLGGYTTLTKAEYFRSWKANAAGVDLNRNFDALFERIDTHPMPAAANYRGPYPFSEPESLALKKYTQGRHFDATISYHATGGEIYYEFDHNPAVNAAGLSLAKSVNKQLHYKIIPYGGKSFGGYKDWAIMKQNIPSLTIEIGKNPAPLQIEEWENIWRRNKNLPYAVAKWVRAHTGVWF